MKNTKKNAQSLIEYGLILALVAIIALTVLSRFGSSITSVGTHASDSVQTAADHAQDNYCVSINGAGSVYNAATGECSAGGGAAGGGGA